MNTVNIHRISPHVLNFFKWTNSKKINQQYNKFSQTYRFIYIPKGSCNIAVDDKFYDCPAGSLFFLPPGTKYSSVPTSDEIFIFNIFFDIVYQNEPIDSVAFDKTHLFTQYKIIDKWEFTDYSVFNRPCLFLSDSAAHICNKILRETDRMKPLYMEYLNVYIHQIMLCLAREHDSEENGEQSDISQRIIDYIAKNIHSNIDATSISQHFSYHPNYIARLMKKATGTSLHKYILDEKLKMAENLICHTDESITDIAFRLCFSNSSHFTQKFRQKYGLTPSEYRKKYS